MKKWMCLIGVLVISASSFGAISVIQIVEAQGYQASYDHVAQTITWTGGASATLYTDLGVTVSLDSVKVTATFSQLSDYSANGWAASDFSVVDWRLDLLDLGGGNYAGYIEGTQLGSNVFTEIEGAENPSPFGDPWIKQNELFGAGIVQVTAYDFNHWSGSVWADAGGGAAGLVSHNVLGSPDPDLFGSYLTDDYSTSETTVWLYADESAIPEPATMLLLGLGSLLAVRKRKA